MSNAKKVNSFFMLPVVMSLLFLVSCRNENLYQQCKWKNVTSKDGVSIAYSVTSSGDVALVFVHGLSCDSRYWQKQVPYFAKKYQVITIDLPGHGHSGAGRDVYSMEAFGDDVAVVIENENIRKAILIGHSMGGAIILQAAGEKPEEVIGVIGIDTLHNFEEKVTQEQIDSLVKPLEADFRNNFEKFVRDMFPADANQKLVDWVAIDMVSSDKEIAISCIEDYINSDTVKMVKKVSCPIISINSDLWPSNAQANEKYCEAYKLYLMTGLGHFIMLEDSDKFNPLLEKVITEIIKAN